MFGDVLVNTIMVVYVHLFAENLNAEKMSHMPKMFTENYYRRNNAGGR